MKVIKKSEFTVVLIILGFGLLLVNYLLIDGINDIFTTKDVEKNGVSIIAKIKQREPGSNILQLEYVINNRVMKKKIKVSNVVYTKTSKTNKFELKVLKERPQKVTWEGDRTIISTIFSTIQLALVDLIMLFSFIGGITKFKDITKLN